MSLAYHSRVSSAGRAARIVARGCELDMRPELGEAGQLAYLVRG